MGPRGLASTDSPRRPLYDLQTFPPEAAWRAAGAATLFRGAKHRLHEAGALLLTGNALPLAPLAPGPRPLHNSQD